MPDWITDRNESAVETPPSSVCTDTTENIDPLLLASTATPDQTTIHDFIDGDDFIGINEGKRHLLEEDFSVEDAAVIQKRFVAEETISEGNFSSIKLAEEWTSVALDIGDMETKQQRCDTFDAPANLKDTPLGPAPPGSSAASGNKYPPDSRLLFNSTLPQSRCIDSNSVQFVTESQDDGYPPPASVQEIQDIDPSVAVDPDDRQFLVERLVRKRVRRKRVQYLVKWQGYPENENTWEDEKDIHRGLIEIFTAQERFKDSERQSSGLIRLS
ncbi:hypothetical protein GJ744_005001 [Endocarpon pusillum]|uniref:Chromo domain-containing protein n=1 Tax=Endocarpon pusillum TaxID=364733 RepID=A0A8H7A956_9EURO|nr:hypothetical protein GJ744_005001 [Endocarpon pusillum]